MVWTWIIFGQGYKTEQKTVNGLGDNLRVSGGKFKLKKVLCYMLH